VGGAIHRRPARRRRSGLPHSLGSAVYIKQQIDALERAIKDAVGTYAPAQLLMTIHGCGPILALTSPSRSAM